MAKEKVEYILKAPVQQFHENETGVGFSARTTSITLTQLLKIKSLYDAREVTVDVDGLSSEALWIDVSK